MFFSIISNFKNAFLFQPAILLMVRKLPLPEPNSAWPGTSWTSLYKPVQQSAEFLQAVWLHQNNLQQGRLALSFKLVSSLNMIILLLGFIAVFLHTAAIRVYRPACLVTTAFLRLWELLCNIPGLNSEWVCSVTVRMLCYGTNPSQFLPTIMAESSLALFPLYVLLKLLKMFFWHYESDHEIWPARGWWIQTLPGIKKRWLLLSCKPQFQEIMALISCPKQPVPYMCWLQTPVTNSCK